MTVYVNLDIEVHILEADVAAFRERVDKESSLWETDSGLVYDDEFGTDSKNPQDTAFRWSRIAILDLMIDGDTYNCLNYRHRRALKDRIVSSDLRDVHLKSLWKSLGQQYPLHIYWTVKNDYRRGDVEEDADQEDYNRIMLSPLEQLAVVAETNT